MIAEREPFVSIVVPTHNRAASLTRLLRSLARQTYPDDRFEVVVVDDGSSDATAGLVRGLDTPYVLHLLGQPNRGPAAARNLGVDSARGDLIVFLDDDVVPLPRLLTEHVATHRSERDAVVVGPMSPPAAWPRPAWIRWEEAKLHRVYRAMLAGDYPCTARQFYTANASLSRRCFLEAGGFDTGFERAEDVELGYRLAARGARFLFSPRAGVLHYASRGFAAWCRVPYRYGRYDVIMEVEKGYGTLQLAAREFHQRHPLNRVTARAFVGHRTALRVAARLLGDLSRAADRVGLERPAALALSGLYNLLYWQGVSDALGGPAGLWAAVARQGRPDRSGRRPAGGRSSVRR